MKTLLFVSHAISKNTIQLERAALRGITEHQGETAVSVKSARDIVLDDILTSSGILIATSENIGYMAGITKDMFDRTYNGLLGKKEGLPVAVYIRAGLDGTATKQAMTSIFAGLRWRLVQPPLILRGTYERAFEDKVEQLCAGFSAGLDAGIF